MNHIAELEWHTLERIPPPIRDTAKLLLTYLLTYLNKRRVKHAHSYQQPVCEQLYGMTRLH